MDKDLRRTIDIFVDVLLSLEPRALRLRPWISTVVETTEKWFRSEGNQGVKRMKDILGKGLLAIFHEDLGEPLSFVKADSSNLPILARPFVETFKRYQPDVRLMSAAVSLSRLPDLWFGQDDLGSIRKTLETI